MDAQKYFETLVVPTYKEFEQDRLNLPRALLASLVLYHLLDYVNADRGGTKGELGALQKKTRERCAAFKAVEALAFGTKHVKVCGPDHITVLFSSDHIACLAAGTVIDRRETEQGAIREFKIDRPMLWFDYKDQRQFVDVVLFTALKYLAYEFRLHSVDNIELPMQLAYRTTPA